MGNIITDFSGVVSFKFKIKNADKTVLFLSHCIALKFFFIQYSFF